MQFASESKDQCVGIVNSIMGSSLTLLFKPELNTLYKEDAQ